MPLFLYVCTLGTWVEVREQSAEALGIELRSRARQQAPVLTAISLAPGASISTCRMETGEPLRCRAVGNTA